MVNIDVLARDQVFRVGETRASVTKYAFFLIKVNDDRPGMSQGPLANPLEPLIASSVWGNIKNSRVCRGPIGSPWLYVCMFETGCTSLLTDY